MGGVRFRVGAQHLHFPGPVSIPLAGGMTRKSGLLARLDKARESAKKVLKLSVKFCDAGDASVREGDPCEKGSACA